jgi:small subunit ribosomal protein S2
MQKSQVNTDETIIDAMFGAGVQFGFSKARRHPSIKPYIFGIKNKTEIFDLEKTAAMLKEAANFVAKVAGEGKTILFIGGKAEARVAVEDAAASLAMPYAAGRWIGGTFTNFVEIKKRIEKLKDLSVQKEKGELAKYTKKERLLIDKEIDNLTIMYGGLGDMKEMPGAVVVVDSKHEAIAVDEARSKGIPVVALCGSDCDLTKVNYPVVGNDTSRASIALFLKAISEAYKTNKK